MQGEFYQAQMGHSFSKRVLIQGHSGSGQFSLGKAVTYNWAALWVWDLQSIHSFNNLSNTKEDSLNRLHILPSFVTLWSIGVSLAISAFPLSGLSSSPH